MKVLFAIKALNNAKGGAERVLADVTAGLAGKEHDISILSFDTNDGESFYPLHSKVRRICLGLGKTDKQTTVSEALSRILNLRKTVKQEKPDIVIAFMHSMFVPMALALIGTGVPVIASEHIVPAHYKTRRLEFFLLCISSFLVKKITVLSESVKSSYPSFMRRKMIAIANPVAKAEKLADPSDKSAKIKTILNVGRLELQKDQETLIKAFAMITDKYPDWQVKIMGDGALRPNLEKLVKEYDLKNKVILPGTTQNIAQEYQNAHIFALPSSYESFGLATAEAMAHGLPVIGFADCPGTNELINNGKNGMLISSSNKTYNFAKGLEQLICSEELRLNLGKAGIEITQKYAPDKIITAWKNLITN